MHTLNKTTLFFAVSLSALAGYVDAIGFLELGRIFVSFMSGNTTQMAVELARNNWERALLLSQIICCFVTGAALGTTLGHFVSPEKRIFTILSGVVVLLILAAISYRLGMQVTSILLVAVAMGIENTIFERAGEITVGVTYISGTLVKLGQRIAQRLLGSNKDALAPYFLLWLGLIMGGIAGALAYNTIGASSGLWLGATWSALLAIVAKLKNMAPI